MSNNVQTVFADCADAVRIAEVHGLPKNATVLTTSPYLIERKAGPALGSAVTLDRTRAFCADIHSSAEQAYKTLSDNPATSEYALTAARAIVRSGIWTYKAVLLGDNDLSSPFITTRISTSKYDWINGPWTRILSTHPNYRGEVCIPETDLRVDLSAEEEVASFSDRLSFEPWQSIALRVLGPIFKRRRISRGVVLTCGLNGLIKESAVTLGLRGYSIIAIPRPRLDAQDLPNNVSEQVSTVLRPLLEDLFVRYVSTAILECVVKELLEEAISKIGRYCSGRTFWSQHLEQVAPVRPKAILVNHFAEPEGDALFHEARERDILVCGVQHGTSPEVSPVMRTLEVEQDAAGCDRFFCFGDDAARNATGNRFGVCQGIPVGASRELQRARSRGTARRDELPPILYVTNQCYMGNMHRPVNFGISDHAAHLYEARLFKEVFKRLPHRVLYKTYPAFRYPDPDPSVEVAQQIDNIDVFAARTDLRYLLHRARVIVLSLGHSTVTWCLMSGKPIAFIEQVDQNPLNETMRKLFQKATFYVRTDEPDWREKLHSYLSRPLDEIERDWSSKSKARAELTHALAGRADGRGGERIANYIEQIAQAR